MIDAQQHDPSAEKENQTPIDRPIAGGRAISATRDLHAQLGAFTANATETHEGLGLDLREYWHILIKRKWLVATIVAAFMVIGVLWASMATPLYTSTVRLQIDLNVAKVVENGNITPTEQPYDSEFLRTQYELLQSRSMAERVASMARLADDLEFLKPKEFSILRMFRGGGKLALARAERERAASGVVLNNRLVRPLSGSRLVDVSYSDPDPARAQRIASAYADAFIDSNLDKRFQANAYAKTFLGDQIKQLKLRLED